MNRFTSFSIRTKLTLIVMTGTCVALIVAAAALVMFDQMSFRDWMSQYTLVRAGIIADSSIAGLSFGDSQPAEELLHTFIRADPHLGAVAVYDKDGRVFARYARPGWDIPPASRSAADFVGFAGGRLEVTRAVKLGGQHLGSVLMLCDLEELHQRRNNGLVATFFVMVGAAAVGFIFSQGLQRFISQPIRQLSEISHEVAVRKNYSIRVPKQGDDELGQLVDGFNEMLSQIETRDTALRDAHAELEQRVVIRTSELHFANERLQDEVDAHKRASEESDALRHRLETAYGQLQREAEERSQVQEALRRSEERFSKAFRASPVPLAIITRNSRTFVDVNDRFAELAELKRDDIIGQTIFSLSLWSQPETRARIEQLLADGRPLQNWECRIAGSGSQTRAALLSTVSFQLGSEPCLLFMTEDVSERVNLEGQLRQAQKMEAIGQLASGVAHDFNNLLTIVQGYTQLILAEQPADSPLREPLDKITGATERAAKLTGQLLTFSRKQVAQLKPVELNQIVTNLTAMLRPLLGESVSLVWQPATGLPAIEADPGMIEQVLVNLAVNARDAMLNGGELVIRTFTCQMDANQLPYQPQAVEGSYVCLQVSDTGCGMDPATLERIFEPFFTTKGVGKGTGLGLATVYGIVKQHRGWVEVASQVGLGTTFKIFIPAVQASPSAVEANGDSGAVRGGHETILVVEDEPSLRELVTQILHGLGYEVLQARHGKEALQVWQHTPRKPELLLTDMMMPEGLSGWQLAEQLRAEAPGLKIVYTSGYSPELFSGQVQLQDHSNFVAKPFHPRTLARTVRQCLDN